MGMAPGAGPGREGRALAQSGANPETPATDTPSRAVTIGPSGRPLPRFASLRSDHINMRTGPGTRYPVTWVYRRPGLPVEIVRETADWRQVRDPDGAEGWVHKIMLSNSARTAMVTASAPTVLRRRPEPDAAGVAEIEPGVILTLLQCPPDNGQCRVETGRFQGWLPRAALWGVYPGEDVD